MPVHCKEKQIMSLQEEKKHVADAADLLAYAIGKYGVSDQRAVLVRVPNGEVMELQQAYAFLLQKNNAIGQFLEENKEDLAFAVLVLSEEQELELFPAGTDEDPIDICTAIVHKLLLVVEETGVITVTKEQFRETMYSVIAAQEERKLNRQGFHKALVRDVRKPFPERPSIVSMLLNAFIENKHLSLEDAEKIEKLALEDPEAVTCVLEIAMQGLQYVSSLKKGRLDKITFICTVKN